MRGAARCSTWDASSSRVWRQPTEHLACAAGCLNAALSPSSPHPLLLQMDLVAGSVPLVRFHYLA